MYKYHIISNNINGDKMKIKDIMTKDIITGKTNDTVLDISKKMKDNDIGFIPILDKEDVVGVVTDRDIVINVLSNNGKNTDLIKDYMTKNVIDIDINSNFKNTINKMKDYKIKRIIVSDKGKMVGIISISDFVNSDIENNDILNSIKHIWQIKRNDDNKKTEIDEFYL